MDTDSFPQIKSLLADLPLAGLLLAGTLFSLAFMVEPIAAWADTWVCHW